MYQCTRNYIGGEWIEAGSRERHPVINPATEEAIGTVVYGSGGDVDRAVSAARSAFATYADRTVAERLDVLHAITAVMKKRLGEIGAAGSIQNRTADIDSGQFLEIIGAIHRGLLQ